MKYLFTLLLLGALAAQAQTPAEKALQKMHTKYYGKWYKTFTFVQTTENYRNDSLLRKSTWYEAIQYPDKFRIDFGLPAEGNAAIWNGDSMYRFVKGELKRTAYDKNDLLFILGGLYFHPFETTKTTLSGFGYDLNKYTETTFKGEPVFVIGANDTTEKVNQLWYDKKRLLLLRMIRFENGRREDGIFEDHKAMAGGFTETKVSFYFDNKLAQVEYYTDCRANVPLEDVLFNPADFGKWHWYKPE